MTPTGIVTEVPHPHRRQRPLRHHHRSGRQSLVHRARRQQNRKGDTHRHLHRVCRPDRRQWAGWHHQPDPTATSGSPELGANQIGTDDDQPAPSRSTPSPPPAATPMTSPPARRQPLVRQLEERRRGGEGHPLRHGDLVPAEPLYGPNDIVAGPDGNLWFTARQASGIGRTHTRRAPSRSSPT